MCVAMGSFAFDALPEPMVAYCRAGLDAYRAGGRTAMHFQQPGDPIACDPAVDRLLPLPDPGSPGAVPGDAVRAFAEQAVGRITTWTDASDVSWAREESRVWRAHGADGGTWSVKVHQNDRFHQREVTALRGWVPTGLGAAAPRLVAADAELRAVALTAVGGRSLQGATYPPEQQRRIFFRIGQLAAAIHRSAPPRPAVGPLRLGKLEGHLDGARPHRAPGGEEFIRTTAQKVADLPALAEVVPTHGDFQLLH